MACKLGCIGILTNSARFTVFKQHFDEFRVAAIKYTFTVGNRQPTGGAAPAEINYWPNSFLTMLTSFDRTSQLNEEYLQLQYSELATSNDHPINIATAIGKIVSEPSCKIKSVAGTN